MKNIFITASDGYRLSALYASPVYKKRGTIVISSATGIKKEFYINFAMFLIGQGYTVLLYDYRGIGGSAPDDLRTMDAYMHEWGTKDMNAVLKYLVEEQGLTCIIWLGHSVGAQLVGFLENPEHISKVISINSALGYWGYFPFPMKWLIWMLWYFIGPLMIKIYGYGVMTKIGWGENLPRNMMWEWRAWCLNKSYFKDSLNKILRSDQFCQFTIPITAVYTSDDFIANDKTVPLMMKFFPNSPQTILKLSVKEHTKDKVGHTGIFRKKFRANLWPLLMEVIEK
ncbi:alpha/beta hydrolase family protein [Dyadobacter arcticus]|uniref:Alpha/beta hydrolase n=1 Tax=Dyadobacter arcticus TaxID=1078754 RepID=A0ABX0UHK6_9BACT|nr:alpha/beta fold hydrolase [Dyadobacter arcticus]NIJ52504.1 putative alpha/beta hydrolase [Dyadobacter arcticus]